MACDIALEALRLTEGNLSSLIGARVNLGLREEADQNLRLMMTWRQLVQDAISVLDRDECICPKCGIRHGGRKSMPADF